MALIAAFCLLTGCDYEPTSSEVDRAETIMVGDRLAENQPTPKNIKYSLERYNLIKRALWVNGLEAEARALQCPVEKPIGYIALLTQNGIVVSTHIVDGKVSSLNSFLTPDSEYYEKNGGSTGTYYNRWLPDVDGSYGNNVEGIFFFDETGEYHEWPASGLYEYSSSPFELTVTNTIIGSKEFVAPVVETSDEDTDAETVDAEPTDEEDQ